MTTRIFVIGAMTIALGNTQGSAGANPAEHRARAADKRERQAAAEALRKLRKRALQQQTPSSRRPRTAGAESATAPGAARRERAAQLVEHEPNDAMPDSTPLEAIGPGSVSISRGRPSVEVVASLDPIGDIDYYSIRLRAGDVLRVDVDGDKEGADIDPVLRAFGPLPEPIGANCGAQLAERDDGNGLLGISLDPCVLFTAPADGLYAIEVSSFLPGVGGPDQSYILNLTLRSRHETEPNDNPAFPNPLAPRQARPARGAVSTAGGVIDSPGDVDCYDAYLRQGEVLNVDLDAFECANFLRLPDVIDPTLTLFDPNLVAVAFDDDTEDLDSGLLFTAEETGTHVLCVEDFDASWSDNHLYEIILQIQDRTECEPAPAAPPAPPNSPVSENDDCPGCRLSLHGG